MSAFRPRGAYRVVSPGGDPNMYLILLVGVGAIGAAMAFELGGPRLGADSLSWPLAAGTLARLPHWLSAPTLPSAEIGLALLWLAWLVVLLVLGFRLLVAVALGNGDVGYAHTWSSLIAAAVRRTLLAAGLLTVVGFPGAWPPLVRLPMANWPTLISDALPRLVIVLAWTWLAWSSGLVLMRMLALATSGATPRPSPYSSNARRMVAASVEGGPNERWSLAALIVGLAVAFWALLVVLGPPHLPRLPAGLPSWVALVVQLQSPAPSWQLLVDLLALAAWGIWLYLASTLIFRLLVAAAVALSRGAAWARSLGALSDAITLPIMRRMVSIAFAVSLVARTPSAVGAAPLEPVVMQADQGLNAVAMESVDQWSADNTPQPQMVSTGTSSATGQPDAATSGLVADDATADTPADSHAESD